MSHLEPEHNVVFIQTDDLEKSGKIMSVFNPYMSNQYRWNFAHSGHAYAFGPEDNGGNCPVPPPNITLFGQQIFNDLSKKNTQPGKINKKNKI